MWSLMQDTLSKMILLRFLAEQWTEPHPTETHVLATKWLFSQPYSRRRRKYDVGVTSVNPIQKDSLIPI